MIEIVLSESLETKRKYVEAVEIKTDQDYVDFVKRVEKFNENKTDGRTWKIIEVHDPDLKECLLENQRAERNEAIREREDIDDYFKSVEYALEELKNIYNKKY